MLQVGEENPPSSVYSRRPVIPTSGFGGFLLPVCICCLEKSALESLAWAHMKTWICPLDCFTCGTPNESYTLNQFFNIWNLGCYSFTTKILGTVRDMGKILFGFCSQYISRKVTEAFQEIPSSFGAVVRTPGLRG